MGNDTKSQNFIIKQQIRSVECRHLSQILWKTASHAKFHWNRTIGCWVVAKIDFQYGGRPPYWILWVQEWVGLFVKLMW